LRVGIDRDDDLDAKEYVLGNFSKAEQKTLKDLSATTNQIIGFFLEGRSFDSIMNDFNKK
jgi:peptidyl-tRNA hydrolase